MAAIPDRVSLDLRKHERQQHEAEIEYRAEHPVRVFEATEAVRDPEKLRRILDDEALAGPLTELCQALPGLGQELGKLKTERRIEPEAIVDLERAARAIAKIERQLIAWEIGE